MTEPALLQHLRPRTEEMLAALALLVNHESPSGDRVALDALAHVLAARLGAVGADVRLVANPSGGDHVRARFGAASDPGRPALVLAHYDTIWPAGTLAALPFRREGGRAFGPGIYDMKASLVILEFALSALVALDLRPPRPIVALLTSDEEIGSPGSRGLIEELATGCAYTLVLEPPLADGGLKTARKGVGRFTLEIVGRPAHAGVEPEKGISAVQELAHQVLHIHRLGDPEAGTTVNVGVVQGGTAPNVVAARATALVDVRVTTADEERRLDTALRGLHPVAPGARIAVGGGFNRPPMERAPQVVALFQRARLIGRSLGLDLTEGATGGASDANFTAALGVPTLDGLGARGAGAHAEHEQIEIGSLPERAALLAALLLEL
ncbi:MAG TPA: M20 family metallopeptidase [Isosphaeraceae bacterium]